MSFFLKLTPMSIIFCANYLVKYDPVLYLMPQQHNSNSFNSSIKKEKELITFNISK